jgi:hypothetical protein
MREEVLPIFAIGVGAETLLPRHDVEDDQTVVRYVVLHDSVNVPGVEGRCKPLLKRPDRCVIVGCGNSGLFPGLSSFPDRNVHGPVIIVVEIQPDFNYFPLLKSKLFAQQDAIVCRSYSGLADSEYFICVGIYVLQFEVLKIVKLPDFRIKLPERFHSPIGAAERKTKKPPRLVGGFSEKIGSKVFVGSANGPGLR